ncbi:hypothetical protein AGMMS49975_11670 [Clostridia bacterium]|nr:hypothetical protein AGMMS49975_11670 [Clostridia bacterium]
MAEILPIDNNYNVQNTQAEYRFSSPEVRNAVNDRTEAGEKQKKVTGTEECQTCKNRKYQDGSDDPGVSFKTPGNIKPEESASKVFAHEGEHFSREAAKAKEEGREVVSNTISVYTSVCPECGKVYTAGGETRTVTRDKAESKLSFAQDFYQNTVGKHRGAVVDKKL